MPKTKAGDCSWKPQPSCEPPARSASSRPASAQNESNTPSVKIRPCFTTLPRSLPDWFTKPSTLMPSTGNTQGMRLRMRPPSSASKSVPARPAAGGAETEDGGRRTDPPSPGFGEASC